MDKNELEQIRINKEREAEEFYRQIGIDYKRRVVPTCPVEPFWEDSPFKGPQYVDPFRWVEPLKRRWRDLEDIQKKILRRGISYRTTPYDECSCEKKVVRRGISRYTTPYTD